MWFDENDKIILIKRSIIRVIDIRVTTNYIIKGLNNWIIVISIHL